jgi:hypothetical protein
MLFFVQLMQLEPPLCIESVIDLARIRIVACAGRMCILADIDMFCQFKWVAHAGLLTQSMFVMVRDWLWVEVLSMVWTGPLHENYRGRIEHVFPMHAVVTLGSHFTLNTKSIQTSSHSPRIVFCATWVVGTAFVHIKCDYFCCNTLRGLCCTHVYLGKNQHVLSTQVGGP